MLVVAARRIALTILALLATAPAQGQQVRLSEAQQVQQAIDRAVQFLLRSQQGDGGWDEVSNYPLGVSSLVTLALLNAGQDPNSPAMSDALVRISSQRLERTYCVALQTMAFCTANPNRYAPVISRNAQWLLDAQQNDGGWAYDKGNSGVSDASNTQFALLALHEAQRTGIVQIEGKRWRRAFEKCKKYWISLQNRDGSFLYRLGDPRARASMVCAGIASLVIVGAQLDELEATADGGIQCCGSQEADQDRIEAAFGWLNRNFSVQLNPGHDTDQLYYLYALERAGRLTGRRFIGDHDWYREGALEILRLQDGSTLSGQIKARRGYTGGNIYSETAFALLFLSKGNRQLVVSRLKFGRDEDWNHHATAIQNLTAHTEQAWKRDLSWQTIDLERASAKDLLESPVLFISGTRVPSLSAAQKALLKEYVEQGGFIFAEGCVGDGCNGAAFEAFFNSLAIELFDKPLEKLPPDHPVWFAESRVIPSDLPSGTWLYGVQTCCRLGVVYCPTSLSCRWELNPAYGLRAEYPPQIDAELKSFTKIGLNVLAYATGKELKEKLDQVTILEDSSPELPTDRGALFLPVVRHNAGFDDASRATGNLMQWFAQEMPFNQSSEKRIVSLTDPQLSNYPIAFMHGRGKVLFTDAQREALRSYLNFGGFLFVNSVCADLEFTESFRREMEIVLSEPLRRLDGQHPLLRSAEYGGFDIRQVRMIDPDKSGDQIIASQRVVTPVLEVGMVDRRIGVIFSPLDLSCALESRHSLQCRGYVRDDAARIGINVLLFALQQE